MKPAHAWTALLLACALVAGGGWWLQRETKAALESELASLRHENRNLARLRQENEKMRATQPSEEELARLRADRAALLRLRTEIERMQARAEQMGRAEKAVK